MLVLLCGERKWIQGQGGDVACLMHVYRPGRVLDQEAPDIVWLFFVVVVGFFCFFFGGGEKGGCHLELKMF